MGMEQKGEKQQGKEKFVFTQTEGGAFSSRPEVEDVYNLLHGNLKAWQESEQSHMDDGHGEYIENVEAAVDYCKKNGILEVGAIQKMLDGSEPEDIKKG